MAGLSLHRLRLGLQRPMVVAGGGVPLDISGTPVLTATEDQAYTGFTVSASGGTPPYSYSLVGDWPAGISINSSTGEVSGTPTAAGPFSSLSVRVTDNAAATDDLPTFALAVTPTVLSPPALSAIYAEAYDLANGWPLYGKSPNTISLYPASTIKMMTALLCVERKSAVLTSETVTITAADLNAPAGVSEAGFLENDVVTWEGLLYGLMLASGADAALAIARVIGDEIYVENGSTGNQGVSRFVEEMNSRAAELGMTNTTFTDPYGFSGAGNNNASAHDLNTLAGASIANNATIQAIAATASLGITITGVNARTLTVDNSNRFINGPTLAPAGVSDANVLGGKTGSWVDTAPHPDINAYNLSFVWESPNGTKVAITTLESHGNFARYLDARAILYKLVEDFPYLADGVGIGSDAYWANVKILIGANGSIVDESSVGRALTVSGATVDASAPILGSGSILYDSSSDVVQAPDAADLEPGSGDFTIETWYAGSGVEPGTNVENVWFAKMTNPSSPNRAFALQYYNGIFTIFASSDGTTWASVQTVTLGTLDRTLFFNGAPRHLALAKEGSSIRLYVNGERIGNPVTLSSIFDGAGPVNFGSPVVAPQGRQDECRYTVGAARYTAAMHTIEGRPFPRS